MSGEKRDLIDLLTECGNDTKAALARCIQKRDLYIKLLGKLATGPDLVQLEEAIQENDSQKIFEVAHSLKGVLGNLGLSSLYTQISTVVEQLRKNNLSEALPLLISFQKEFRETVDLIQKNLP